MTTESQRPKLRAISGGTPEGTGSSSRANRRGSILPVAITVGTLAILGVTGHLGNGNHLGNGSTAPTEKVPGGGLTEAQLRAWPKANTDVVTVTQGEGASVIGEKVDPEVYGLHGNEATAVHLNDMIQSQARGEFLQPGDDVEVPDIHPNIPPANPNDPNIQPAG